MKVKRIFLIFFGAFCFLGLTGLAFMQSGAADNLKLTVAPSKTSYKLGEVVALSFELKNEDKKTISIADVFGVGTGNLSVLISQDSGQTFQKYEHGWGLLDVVDAATVLKAGESVKTSATVLQHYKPNGLAGENNEVIEKVRKTTIMTDYAFPKAGVYFIKATYVASLKDQPQAVRVESEPIQLIIEEPNNAELEIWNKIKDNGDMAYFLQEGDFKIPNYQTQERNKIQQQIEQIIAKYPNTFYAESLRQGVEKFNVNEEKRKAAIQKSPGVRQQ